MEELKEEINARKALVDTINQLNKITSKDLVRTNELGTALNFQNGIPVFERTLQLFRDLPESSLDKLPLQTLKQLKQAADNAVQGFNQIKEFNPAQSNPTQARDQLISTVANQYHGQFTLLAPIIAYSVRKGTDFAILEQEARDTVDNMKSRAVEQEKAQKILLKETQSILDKVRQAAAEVGVAQHAIHFKEQADSHRNSSKHWLWAAVVAGLVTVLFALFSTFLYIKLSGAPSNLYESIQMAVSRLLVFSVLSAATIWCGKNFSAHRHNQVVNTHRHNALRTFETFVKAATDPETKNAVLLQATQSIFALQRSGYLGKDVEIQGQPQIVEILRQITSGQGQ